MTTTTQKPAIKNVPYNELPNWSQRELNQSQLTTQNRFAHLNTVTECRELADMLMEPELLTCDGELTVREVQSKVRAIIRDFNERVKQIEKST